MRKDNFQQNSDSERGSALLLSLGILALVLILAMSFAYSANTRLRVAKSQGGTTDARVLADQAVQQVMSDMIHLFDKTETASGGERTTSLYPPVTMESSKNDDVSSDTDYNQNMLLFQKFTRTSDKAIQMYAVSHNNEDVATADHRNYVYQQLGLDNLLVYMPQLEPMKAQLRAGLSFMPPLTMEYQLSKGTDSTTVSRVTGRYAYILLDETNKFSINQLINFTGEPPAAIHRTGGILGGSTNFDRLAPALEVTNVGAADGYYGFNIYGAEVPNVINSYSPNLEAIENTAQTFRLGLVPEEIEVSDVDYFKKLELFDGLAVGWLSNEQLCEAIGTKFTDTDVFRYTPMVMEDKEAWYDEVRRKEMSRFDLTGVSWEGTAPSANGPVDKGTLVLDYAKTGWKKEETNVSWLEKLTGGYDPVTSTRDELKKVTSGGSGASGEGSSSGGGGSNTNGHSITPGKSSQRVSVQTGNGDGENISRGANNNASSVVVGEFPEVCTSIDWLHRMVDDKGESVAFDVAANIKDYSDNDNYTTTDFSPSSPFSKDLMYSGNEKVAYINEIALKSNFTKSTDPYIVQVYAGVELLNLYCNPNDDHSEAECNVPAGHVKVLLKGKLHIVWREYEYRQDGENAPNWELITDDPNAQGELIHQLKSEGKDWLILDSKVDGWYKHDNLGNDIDGDVIPSRHLGYNTFYLKKKVKVGGGDGMPKLQSICDITDSEEIKILDDCEKVVTPALGEKKAIYAFFVEINQCIAYTYDNDADSSMLYDVAMPLPIAAPEEQFRTDWDTEKNNYFVPTQVLSDYGGENYNEIKPIVDFESTDSRCNHRAGEPFWKINKWNSSGTNTLTKNNTGAFPVNQPPSAGNSGSGGGSGTGGGSNTNGKKSTLGHVITLQQANTGSASESENSSNAGGGTNIDYESGVNFGLGDSKDVAKGYLTYSTAFIRNAPMQSLWELGAIHRAYPNQTVNLKKFTAPARLNEDGTKNNVENIKYADGDAGMLDQVKIGPLLYVEGKVNANMRNPIIWQDLFGDITLGWYDLAADNYAVFGVESTSSNLDYTKFTEAWDAATRTLPTSYSRGAIAEILGASGVFPAGIKNDRDYEGYIGKTAQLLTTRCEMYSLLLYAEALDDITVMVDEAIQAGATLEELRRSLGAVEIVRARMPGTSPGTGSSGYENRYCKVSGRQKVLVQLVRDAWTNELKMVGKKYLEE